MERERSTPLASSPTRPPYTARPIFHLWFLCDLLRVWDAPRPEFWPTLTWDRHSRQLGARMDVEVLAELPAILREAEGTPEYQQLWWAWRTLSSVAAEVGGLT